MTSVGPVNLDEPASIPLPASPPTSVRSSHAIPADPIISTIPSGPLAESEDTAPTSQADDAESISAESDATVEPSIEQKRRSSIDMIGSGINLDVEMNSVWPEDQENGVRSSQPFETENKTTLSALIGQSDIEAFPSPDRPRSDSSGSVYSSDSDQVDWSDLDSKEEAEPRGAETDESTAFLLARLEQENNALATDPRFGLKEEPKKPKQGRPPSINVMKRLVREPSRASISHLAQIPEPPPMTELEFWAALVKDYAQTAQRLPTLTSNKIKDGVPPPLRGVVWLSMVGGRDDRLSEIFDKLLLETSPYENMIGKDIGRSFPGVDMFKEAGGHGQQMLAKVLKVFSLYDEEIGYCQGLGFLVGPLLMQMEEKDAFCVLVRLMEQYDLRSCFMPDLAGLHLRIFQFQRLLTQHMPELSAHLESLSVEAAYLSQWFLSFFAVTSPLPMLFRIYDVILAEGASETVMRVALSLMRRNESRLMALSEFEEVMQLLLSRSLWEPYAYNADDLVNDFVGFTGLVTREALQKLDKQFRESKGGAEDPAVRVGRFADASSAASRFLGRLLTAHSASKSQSNLSPPDSASPAPRGFMKRSPSKQSIASTINNADNSSESTTSVDTGNTEATAISRDSSAEGLSINSKTESVTIAAIGAVSKEDKDLHGQIEDLLTALGEMQRDQGLLNAQFQKEREEREEDHKLFTDILLRIKKEPTTTKADRRQTAPSLQHLSPETVSIQAELGDVAERIDERLSAHRDLRRSSMLESKARLRQSLNRSKDQLSVEMARSQELSKRLDEQEQENTTIKDQLGQARSRLQEGLRERRRLEKVIEDLKPGNRNSLHRNSLHRSSVTWSDSSHIPSLRRSDTLDSNRMSLSSNSSNTSPTSPPGLKELNLNRNSSSSTSRHAKSNSRNNGNGGLSPGTLALPNRSSSLVTSPSPTKEQQEKAGKADEMLVELVNSKTSEAMARQELEEVKARLDTMRRMMVFQQQQQQNSSSQPLGSPTLTVTTDHGGGNASGHAFSKSEGTVLMQASTGQQESPSLPRPKSGDNEPANSTNSLTPPTPTPSAKGHGSAGSIGGFWPWGRRTTSTANATIPPDKEDKK
ncbi:MAG: hypothetical protein M1831_002105 [Alyxoria varia]|nr:MAG: hypothetical protein M1831_002105 [Alyxoria varia]